MASKGHAEHTQASDTQAGFSGAMPRPIRVVMIGAGSSFTPRLANDLLLIPGADRGVLGLVDTDRNAATIILDTYGIVRMVQNGYFMAMPGQRLVDGIVDDLEDHVVQAGPVIRVPYVHTRTFADGIQAFENLN